MNSQMSKYDDLKSNIKFLKLIEKYECLWKHDSPYYTSRQVKTKAWKEIAAAVNSTDQRCSRRWRYIRQSYATHVRAVYRTDKIKSSYYLSPHVDFVRPYVILFNCHSDDSNTNQSRDDLLDETSKRQNKERNPEEEKSMETEYILKKLIEETGENNTNTKIDDPQKSASSSSSLKRKVEINASEPNITKYSKTNGDKNKDSSKNLMFLESILPFVDEMSRKQIRRFRRKAMFLLGEILENKQINKPELVK